MSLENTEINRYEFFKSIETFLRQYDKTITLVESIEEDKNESSYSYDTHITKFSTLSLAKTKDDKEHIIVNHNATKSYICRTDGSGITHSEYGLDKFISIVEAEKLLNEIQLSFPQIADYKNKLEWYKGDDTNIKGNIDTANEYVYTAKNVGGEQKEAIFDLKPKHLNGEFDYKAFDTLVYNFRILIGSGSIPSYIFVNKSHDQVRHELILLLKEMQDKIIPEICITENIKNKNISPYLEIIYFCLYYDKDIELSENNQNILVTSLVNQDNDFIYVTNQFHPLELALMLEHISSENVKKIISHFTCLTPYFKDKNLTQHKEGILKTNARIDWRSLIIASKMLSDEDKFKILNEYFTDEDVEETKELYAGFVTNECVNSGYVEFIDENDMFKEDSETLKAITKEADNPQLIKEINWYRIFYNESIRRQKQKKEMNQIKLGLKLLQF